MQHKYTIVVSAVLGALAVSIGAFGAHALKTTLQMNGYTEVFQTANEYHFYHVFAIALVGILQSQEKFNNKWLTWAGYSFLTGILFFSGSLYILSITSIKILGAITPIGGVFFIGGWILVAGSMLKK
ncbi:MAG: DUF423 domain-containing protein [Raineya sp.]|jgi:uncharacterized membrane protein YgdD (TMEM256/DUF423 family)|nr:DUF423 domain-containing protein [Raineya sp.]